MIATLRKYLIAGVLVWVPIAITVLIINILLDILNNIFLFIPKKWHPETLFGFSIPGIELVICIALLLVTGLLVTNFFGRRLIRLWESTLHRIPLIRSIHGTVKQALEILLNTKDRSFRQVVLIEYPRKGIWSVGFLTNNSLPMTSKATNKTLNSVFIPTTPNPTSGFIVMLDTKEIIRTNMTIEEGFKFIISMGVIATEETTDFS